MGLPPGPRAPTLLQTVHFVRRPTAFMDECRARYGDIFTVRLSNPDRPAPVVFVSDPGTIRQVFTASPQVLHAGAAARPVIGPFVGDNSVLTLDGDAHLRQRKLMLPSFHGERMQAYAAVMREVARAAIAAWPADAPFRLHPSMQEITLAVILRTVFGLADGPGMRALGDALVRILDAGSSALAFLPLVRRDLGPWSPRGRFEARKAAADALLYAEIERRRAEPADRAAARTDVLAMLLAARDEVGEPMTPVELRDELMTLLAAGHETTATALAWTLERVLSHAEVRDRLEAEIDAVVGGDDVTDAHLPRLEYLDAVVKEALRLRPIVPNVARVVMVPLEVRGYELPAGVVLSPSIYLTHRHPDWYPEPHRFRPARWLGVKPDPYAWLPFGGGIRRCLGMAFALYEMKIVLATILAETRLGLAPGTTGRLARRSITYAPRDGVRVVVRVSRASANRRARTA